MEELGGNCCRVTSPHLLDAQLWVFSLFFLFLESLFSWMRICQVAVIHLLFFSDPKYGQFLLAIKLFNIWMEFLPRLSEDILYHHFLSLWHLGFLWISKCTGVCQFESGIKNAQESIRLQQIFLLQDKVTQMLLMIFAPHHKYIIFFIFLFFEEIELYSCLAYKFVLRFILVPALNSKIKAWLLAIG